MAESHGIRVREEMHTGDQQVGGNDKLLPRRRLKQRGIVADAQRARRRASPAGAQNNVRISSNSFTVVGHGIFKTNNKNFTGLTRFFRINRIKASKHFWVLILLILKNPV